MYDSDSDSESTECIKILDEWILTKRNAIYNENIKGPDNSQEVLETYTCSISNFGNELIHAIEKEDQAALTKLGWPNELMNCIGVAILRIEIVDRIKHWCITYPFVKSPQHINQLAAENAGVN